MMKTIGLIMIFLSSTSIGFFSSDKYAQEDRHLRGLIDLLHLIKAEISLYLTPQSEIFKKFENTHLEKIGFIKALNDFNKPKELSQLSYALDKTKEDLKINKEVYTLLRDYSTRFGTLSANEECAKIQRIIDTLEETYKREKEENKSKIRLCRVSGVMGGLALVLLLW